MKKDVIIALDVPGKDEAMRFLSLFEGEKPYVKIGMELFYAEGPDIVKAVKETGSKVFLDLKLHDIPNTVERAMRSLSRLGADMINVHASGTKRMMEAAMQGVTRPDGTRPLVIAVTQLTSTSEEVMHDELLIEGSMEDVVSSYAENAAAAGLDGVVCSPFEAASVHEKLGKDFLTVTPGIRLFEDSKGDQVRVTTPSDAGKLGSDLIVVGRSITRADDPEAAYKRCIDEFLQEENK